MNQTKSKSAYIKPCTGGCKIGKNHDKPAFYFDNYRRSKSSKSPLSRQNSYFGRRHADKGSSQRSSSPSKALKLRFFYSPNDIYIISNPDDSKILLENMNLQQVSEKLSRKIEVIPEEVFNEKPAIRGIKLKGEVILDGVTPICKSSGKIPAKAIKKSQGKVRGIKTNNLFVGRVLQEGVSSTRQISDISEQSISRNSYELSPHITKQINNNNKKGPQLVTGKRKSPGRDSLKSSSFQNKCFVNVTLKKQMSSHNSIKNIQQRNTKSVHSYSIYTEETELAVTSPDSVPLNIIDNNNNINNNTNNLSKVTRNSLKTLNKQISVTSKNQLFVHKSPQFSSFFKSFQDKDEARFKTNLKPIVITKVSPKSLLKKEQDDVRKTNRSSSPLQSCTGVNINRKCTESRTNKPKVSFHSDAGAYSTSNTTIPSQFSTSDDEKLIKRCSCQDKTCKFCTKHIGVSKSLRQNLNRRDKRMASGEITDVKGKGSHLKAGKHVKTCEITESSENYVETKKDVVQTCENISLKHGVCWGKHHSQQSIGCNEKTHVISKSKSSRNCAESVSQSYHHINREKETTTHEKQSSKSKETPVIENKAMNLDNGESKICENCTKKIENLKKIIKRKREPVTYEKHSVKPKLFSETDESEDESPWKRKVCENCAKNIRISQCSQENHARRNKQRSTKQSCTTISSQQTIIYGKNCSCKSKICEKCTKKIELFQRLQGNHPKLGQGERAYSKHQFKPKISSSKSKSLLLERDQSERVCRCKNDLKKFGSKIHEGFNNNTNTSRNVEEPLAVYTSLVCASCNKKIDLSKSFQDNSISKGNNKKRTYKTVTVDPKARAKTPEVGPITLSTSKYNICSTCIKNVGMSLTFQRNLIRQEIAKVTRNLFPTNPNYDTTKEIPVSLSANKCNICGISTKRSQLFQENLKKTHEKENVTSNIRDATLSGVINNPPSEGKLLEKSKSICKCEYDICTYCTEKTKVSKHLQENGNKRLKKEIKTSKTLCALACETIHNKESHMSVCKCKCNICSKCTEKTDVSDSYQEHHGSQEEEQAAHKLETTHDNNKKDPCLCTCECEVCVSCIKKTVTSTREEKEKPICQSSTVSIKASRKPTKASIKSGGKNEDVVTNNKDYKVCKTCSKKYAVWKSNQKNLQKETEKAKALCNNVTPFYKPGLSNEAEPCLKPVSCNKTIPASTGRSSSYASLIRKKKTYRDYFRKIGTSKENIARRKVFEKIPCNIPVRRIKTVFHSDESQLSIVSDINQGVQIPQLSESHENCLQDNTSSESLKLEENNQCVCDTSVVEPNSSVRSRLMNGMKDIKKKEERGKYLNQEQNKLPFNKPCGIIIKKINENTPRENNLRKIGTSKDLNQNLIKRKTNNNKVVHSLDKSVTEVSCPTVDNLIEPLEICTFQNTKCYKNTPKNVQEHAAKREAKENVKITNIPFSTFLKNHSYLCTCSRCTGRPRTSSNTERLKETLSKKKVEKVKATCSSKSADKFPSSTKLITNPTCCQDVGPRPCLDTNKSSTLCEANGTKSVSKFVLSKTPCKDGKKTKKIPPCADPFISRVPPKDPNIPKDYCITQKSFIPLLASQKTKIPFRKTEPRKPTPNDEASLNINPIKNNLSYSSFTNSTHGTISDVYEGETVKKNSLKKKKMLQTKND